MFLGLAVPNSLMNHCRGFGKDFPVVHDVEWIFPDLLISLILRYFSRPRSLRPLALGLQNPLTLKDEFVLIVHSVGLHPRPLERFGFQEYA